MKYNNWQILIWCISGHMSLSMHIVNINIGQYKIDRITCIIKVALAYTMLPTKCANVN